MSVKPFVINIKELNKRSRKQNKQKTDKQIENEISNTSISKMRSPKPKSLIIFTKTLLPLQTFLSRLLHQKEPDFKTQLEVFKGSMTYFIFFGRYLGLFPNIPSDEKEQYPILSRGYTIPIAISLAQLLVAISSFICLMYSSINISTISHMSYYGTSFFCSILLIRLTTNWHELMKQIEDADLDEYIDCSVKFKCNLATVAIISFAFLQDVLSVSSKLATVLECETCNNTFYEQYILTYYGWFFEYVIPYSVPMGIILIILSMIATINMNYYQIFVVCVSLYLQSILEKINMKIMSFNNDYLSSSYWRALREDYTRATQLVRYFDEIVNGLVLILFASNLYFTCLRIFFVLRKDAELGLWQDYAQITTNTYKLYCTTYVVVNFFTVTLIAAKVHSSSLKVAPVLYSVPSHTYCIEVQRFIEQIQGDPVALTGLNFFYVTKGVILPMIGTIVTYELVLLQFSYNY